MYFQAFGVVCCAVCFFLQFPILMLHSTSKELPESLDREEFFRNAAHQSMLVIALAGNVSIFRSFWNIVDIFFMPSKQSD